MLSLWLKSIILLVSTCFNKDPNVSLNYRGISLFSWIYKVYSGISNARIVKYLDDLDRFVDKQVGIRKGRSCQYQIFSLTSIIHNNKDPNIFKIYDNRKAQNISTFASFVNMQKTFAWVDRQLLFKDLDFNECNWIWR